MSILLSVESVAPKRRKENTQKWRFFRQIDQNTTTLIFNVEIDRKAKQNIKKIVRETWNSLTILQIIAWRFFYNKKDIESWLQIKLRHIKTYIILLL